MYLGLARTLIEIGAAIALLLLPGYLALLLAVPAEELPEPMLQTALAVGLSVAILPLGLLFTTLLGLTLTPALFRGLLVLVAVGVVGRLWRLKWQPLAGWRDRGTWPALGVFVGLLGLTLGLRMLQIRGLVVPAWVDGVHHTLMAQLIAEQGRVPADYRPYLDIGPFIYHYGFHALAAGLAWLTGLEVPQAVLVMGQVLNALVGAGVYGLTVSLTGRDSEGRLNPAPLSPDLSAQTAGLVAMGVVGMVSLMPAYYVTWGRYTQLTGLVVLPAAVVLTLWWVESGRRWGLVLGAVAVAGLGVVHYRVLVFYGAFVVAVVVYRLVMGLGGSWRVREDLLRVGMLAGVSLALLSPWIVRIAQVLAAQGAWLGLQVGGEYTALPADLLLIPRNLILGVLAASGLVLGVWRRQPGVVLMGGWWVLLAVVSAIRSAMLPASAVVISLFLPAAVLIGYLAAVGLMASPSRRWSQVIYAMMGVVFLWGAAGMRSLINPATILLTQADTDAVTWVREHTPPDARILINSRLWQANIYVGSDAGYWLSVLAKRETVPPPTLYVLGTPAEVERVNDISRRVVAGDLSEKLLQEAGITHVFLASGGDTLDVARLLSNPAFELQYSDGNAWVFGVDDAVEAHHPAAEFAQ